MKERVLMEWEVDNREGKRGRGEGREGRKEGGKEGRQLPWEWNATEGQLIE
jgi:hypothetical protein